MPNSPSTSIRRLALLLTLFGLFPTWAAWAQDDSGPPPAPTDLTATVKGANQVTLSWKHASPDGVLFEIQKKAGAGDFAPAGKIEGATTFPASGLTASTKYLFRVRSTKGD